MVEDLLEGVKAYTLYIIQFKVADQRALYLMFLESIEIEDVVKAKLPGIGVPHFDKTLSNFFTQNLKPLI